MWTLIDFLIMDLFYGLRNPWLGQTMVALSALVDYGIWFLLIIYFIVKKKPYGICYGLTLVSGSLFYQYMLKPLFHRPRPCQIMSYTEVAYLIACPPDYSFPSGHTTMSFIAATLLFACDRRVGSVAYVLAFLIGVSRLYLGVHYFSDVLGGMVIGIAIAAVGIIIMKIYEKNK